MLYLWLPFFFDRLRGGRHVVKVRSRLALSCYPFCWSSMSYFVNTAPFLFKSHCLVGQIVWFFILNSTVLLVRKQRFLFNPLPFCWSDSVAFHIKLYRFICQKELIFILSLAVLFMRACWLLGLSLLFYLSGGGGPHIQPHGFVCQRVLAFISDATTLFMKSGRFPC